MRWAAAAAAIALLVGSALGGATPTYAVSETDETSSSGAAPPLVVILDTSGSMSDAVAGVVKLDAAKTALVPIVTSQTAGGNLGIWTYPTSDCGPGSFLHEIGALSTVTDVLASVDALTAGGSTPTAAAIQGVIESLTAGGIKEASLLLISDGLSNCGADPCEVAKSITGSGFDLTVQSVGFDIDAAGRAELECIAGATGGRYFDVKDGPALGKLLAEIGTPQIRVTVTASDNPLAGAPTVVTATVENPSGLTAVDARVNLAFRDAGDRTVFPAVIPPTYPLGNIPAGQSVTRAWTITPGVPDQVADASFVVTAWAASSAPAFVEREFTTRADGYNSDDLGTVFDGTRGDGRSLVILGDSYSSGEGAGPYLPESTKAVEACHRSSRTYLVPVLDAGGIPVDILACSGAVTGDLTADDRGDLSAWRAAPQLRQLAELDRVPGAAVLTAGGNDLGFADIVFACLTSPCNTEDWWMKAYFAKAAWLGEPLTNAYIDVWKTLNSREMLARRDGEAAPVIVLGYPQLTHDTKYGVCVPWFNAGEVAFFNQLALTLNNQIKHSVAEARTLGYEVYFVGGTASAMQPDHTVCAADRWLHGIVVPPQESFHPTGPGYAALTEAVIDWSRTVERSAPSATVMNAAFAGEGMPQIRVPALPLNLDFESIPLLPIVQQGGQVNFSAGGFGAGKPVVAELHSNPMTLASFTADESGVVTGTVHIPDFADIGEHELVLSGPDDDGEYVERVAPLSVTPPTPLWVPLALIGAAAAAIGALVLFLLARRARAAK